MLKFIINRFFLRSDMVATIDSIPEYTQKICTLPKDNSKPQMDWQEISHLLDMKKNQKTGCVFFSHNYIKYYAWQEQVKEDNSNWHFFIQSETDYELSKRGHWLVPEVDVTSDSAGKIVNKKQMLKESGYNLIFGLQTALEHSMLRFK